jgi:hypothetical protein
MSEEIYPICTDEGQMGVRLDVRYKPRGCPGLGGWKRNASGGWWTRLKGDVACRVWDVAKAANEHCVTLEMDEDRILNVSV